MFKCTFGELTHSVCLEKLKKKKNEERKNLKLALMPLKFKCGLIQVIMMGKSVHHKLIVFLSIYRKNDVRYPIQHGTCWRPAQ